MTYIEKLHHSLRPAPKYEVWGVHPESEGDWFEKAFHTEEEAIAFCDELGPIDNGLGYYEIRKLP